MRILITILLVVPVLLFAQESRRDLALEALNGIFIVAEYQVPVLLAYEDAGNSSPGDTLWLKSLPSAYGMDLPRSFDEPSLRTPLKTSIHRPYAISDPNYDYVQFSLSDGNYGIRFRPGSNEVMGANIRYIRYQNFTFSKGKLKSLQADWRSTKKNNYAALIHTFNYQPDGQIGSIDITRQVGKGKSSSEVKPGKIYPYGKRTFTYDADKHEIATKTVLYDPATGKETKTTSASRRVDAESRTVIAFADDTGSSFDKNEYRLDDLLRIVEKSRYVKSDLRGKVSFGYTDEGQLLKRTNLFFEDGKNVRKIVTDYAMMPSTLQTIEPQPDKWAKKIERNYDADGVLTRETVNGKMRVKDADGNWGPWKRLRY